jgi:regulator of nonsense transcripts 2
MRTQQQAERAEQQRIKNLVLNYDLTDDQTDGDSPSFHYVSGSKDSIRLVGTGSLNRRVQRHGPIQHTTKGEEGKTVEPEPTASTIVRQDSFTDETGPFDNIHNQPRYDKSGNTRQKQRARKLQLGDIDWYGDGSASCFHSLAGTYITSAD